MWHRSVLSGGGVAGVEDLNEDDVTETESPAVTAAITAAITTPFGYKVPEYRSAVSAACTAAITARQGKVPIEQEQMDNPNQRPYTDIDVQKVFLLSSTGQKQNFTGHLSL